MSCTSSSHSFNFKVRWQNVSSINPLISVIIRTVGHTQLARAIASVRRQTYPHIEIRLVHARPNLSVISDAGKIPIFHARSNTALSRAAAANLGLASAQDVFGIFLDEDDEWDANHLARLVAAIDGTPGTASYCDTRLVDKKGNANGKLGGVYSPLRLYTTNIFCIHACLFALESARMASVRLDESLPIFEDWDLWIQLEPHVHYRYVAECSAIWHGEDGTSGAGIGINLSYDLRRTGRRAIFDKWKSRIAERAGSRDELMSVVRELIRQKLWPETSSLLNAVLLRFPQDADALNLQGLAHLRCGEAEKAIPLFERVLAQGERHGVRYNLALAFEATGAIDRAIDQVHKALLLAPGFLMAQELLVRLMEI